MKRLTNIIGNTLSMMYENIRIEKKVVDRDIEDLIANPADRAKLTEAVEYLKQHKEEKTREITLSDNETLIISI